MKTTGVCGSSAPDSSQSRDRHECALVSETLAHSEIPVLLSLFGSEHPRERHEATQYIPTARFSA